MIVNSELGYVFVCPRKTGTLSVRDWLMRHYGGERVRSYHDMAIPASYAGFLIFMTVRNPYQRAYSFWHHVGRVDTHVPSRHNRGIGFRETCEELAHVHGTLLGNQQESGARAFLELEDLARGVQKLPFFDPSKPLPSKARVNGKKPAGGFFGTFDTDSKEAETVRQLFANDFAAFGYST